MQMYLLRACGASDSWNIRAQGHKMMTADIHETFRQMMEGKNEKLSKKMRCIKQIQMVSQCSLADHSPHKWKANEEDDFQRQTDSRWCIMNIFPFCCFFASCRWCCFSLFCCRFFCYGCVMHTKWWTDESLLTTVFRFLPVQMEFCSVVFVLLTVQLEHVLYTHRKLDVTKQMNEFWSEKKERLERKYTVKHSLQSKCKIGKKRAKRTNKQTIVRTKSVY